MPLNFFPSRSGPNRRRLYRARGAGKRNLVIESVDVPFVGLGARIGYEFFGFGRIAFLCFQCPHVAVIERIDGGAVGLIRRIGAHVTEHVFDLIGNGDSALSAQMPSPQEDIVTVFRHRI